MPTRTSTDAEVRALNGLHLYHAKLSNCSEMREWVDLAASSHVTTLKPMSTARR